MRCMIICICHRVTDRDIAGAARQGCVSFEQLQDETRVATACGACHDCARETFHEHSACGRAVVAQAWRPLVLPQGV